MADSKYLYWVVCTTLDDRGDTNGTSFEGVFDTAIDAVAESVAKNDGEECVRAAIMKLRRDRKDLDALFRRAIRYGKEESLVRRMTDEEKMILASKAKTYWVSKRAQYWNYCRKYGTKQRKTAKRIDGRALAKTLQGISSFVKKPWTNVLKIGQAKSK